MLNMATPISVQSLIHRDIFKITFFNICDALQEKVTYVGKHNFFVERNKAGYALFVFRIWRMFSRNTPQNT